MGEPNLASTHLNKTREGEKEMSPYYHEFVPGFNFWYIVAPAFLVVMALAGWCRYGLVLSERDGAVRLRIRRYYDGRLLVVLSAAFALIVTVMIFFESCHGLVQWFDNGLGRYESGVWSIVSAGFTLVLIAVLYGMALLWAALAVSSVRKKTLKRRGRRILRNLNRDE